MSRPQVAFPARDERPVVVDMATSTVPWGKIEEHARLNRPLRPGWAVGGEDASSPRAVLKSGALANLGGVAEATGGHKGYCLAAVVDILVGVLSGGNWGPTVDGFTVKKRAAAAERQAIDAPSASPAVGIGHFFGALRVDGFRDVPSFKRTMDDWICTFRNAPPTNAGEPVLVPGDPEWKAADERRVTGIPVKLPVLCDLLDIATASGVPPPFDADALDLTRVDRLTVDRA